LPFICQFYAGIFTKNNKFTGIEFSNRSINCKMDNTNKNNGSYSKDLQDSTQDQKEMQPEIVIMDLPDVEDIPGQENIKPAPLGEMADITASSADEEGDDIFGDGIDEDIENDPDSNVSAIEKEDLEESANDMPTEDDINLREAALDNTDDNGTPLNEGSFKNNLTGTDLDVPGADLDDDDEEIGEEDEENNNYSLGGDNHDDTPEDNY
jgi:hypothetical protein